MRGHCQVHREVPGISAQRHPPHPAGQAPQRPAQQPWCPRTRINIAGQQVRGEGHPGLGPAGHVRTPRPLPLVVVGDPRVSYGRNLNIGGIQIDRRRLPQRRHP
ncbi:MAG: hypothetical protein ACRDSN_15140, partial [Pseudonocardiaceae bacterium]